ncbi:hypothetical protein NEOKW01_1472 [Nematocida sp. AWRm80]|nr:hypothetical protein NEOKW01_1472 [Nematocida sp. AWRm80]
MKTIEEVKKTLAEINQQIFPIFLSHTSILNLEPEHNLIKEIIHSLEMLWNTYFQTSNRIEEECQKIKKDPDNMYLMGITEGIDIEESLKKVNSALEGLLQTSEQIKKLIKQLGSLLATKIEKIEQLDFLVKYQGFESIHTEISDLSCIILATNIDKLAPLQKKALIQSEYKMYQCLLLCKKILQQKRTLQAEWIETTRYSQIKRLYTSCLFNIMEYLITYKIVYKTIIEQTSLIEGLEHAIETCTEFITSVNDVIFPKNMLKKGMSGYISSSIEQKIIHHETSIQRRKYNIEIILKDHKNTMAEIDHLNWKVGKEAKNIVNMEKITKDKADISIKRLFFLFEDLGKTLKKIEQTVAQYSKLVSNSKKLPYTKSRLFTIKSLDFNYLIVEGDLLSLKEDLQVIYEATNKIYRENPEQAYIYTSKNDHEY